MTVGGVLPLQADGEGETKIVNLKVNDSVNPFGIDTPQPRFSWQMQSDVVGQKQTAYAIKVASDSALANIVWESGKQDSGKSVGIAYNGQNHLQACTTYYWNVTVWDKDGVAITSDTATFDMGLLGDDAWSDSQWISANKQGAVADPPDNFRYVAEGNFTVENGATGFVFNYIDSNNFYMWQIVAGGYLRPHKWVNGVPTSFDATHMVNFSEIIGGGDNLRTTPVNLKVEVTATEIKSYINDQLIDTLTFSEAQGPAPYLGKIGVRSDGTEKGTATSLKLTNYTDNPEGAVVCDYDFSSGNPFFTGEMQDGAFIIENVGVLVAPDGASTFRRSFTPAKEVRSAKLYTAGLGVYDVYMNGQRVGTPQADGSMVYDELKPGYTVPKKRTFSFAYDVTSLIREGENVLSAEVTSGWWTGQVVAWIGKETAIRQKLLLTYTDGTQEWINTNTTDWKTAFASPVLSGDIYMGETYDGNIDTSWRSPGYDDSSWRVPVENTEFTGEITNHVGSPVIVREDLERAVQSVTVYDGATGEADDRYGKIHVIGTYGDEAFTLNPGEKAVVDLGQNFAGWSQVTVEGQKGTVVTLRHGEMLNDNEGLKSRGNDGPEGSIYFANLRGAVSTDTYVMNGRGQETYHATHTYHGFRYVEITATASITVHNVAGLVVTSVNTDTGHISTANADINQLFSNIVWGQYSNYVGIPTDCPQRDERQGWSADTQVFSIAAAYNGDVKSFLAQWMVSARDCQSDGPNNTGAFADYIPNINETGESHGALGWTDAGVIVPYNMYKMYGDTAIIEENWDAMQEFMDVFMASSDKMGGHVIFGDWLAYESNNVPLQELCGVAYYAMDARMMAEMAEAIGRTEDAVKYRQVFEEEKAFFQEKYLDENGALIYVQQTAQLMALMADVLPNEESRAIAAQKLVDSLKRTGVRLQTGFLGTAVIMQVLSDIGENDIAYQLLFQRNNPSWLYSVDNGATTIWERWNSYTKEDGFGDVNMNSFNHYSYGAVAEWMYAYMAGIQADATQPGFKHFILQPTPSQFVGEVNGTFDSAYGTIVSHWKYVDGKFLYDATVPANTTATVYVPVEGDNAVTVNGKAASALSLETDGIEYVETVDGKAQFNAVAGSFQFETAVTTLYTISLESEDPDLDWTIRVNDGEAELMTTSLTVPAGEEITIEVAPVNDVDYHFARWSGDSDATTAKLTLKPDRNMHLVLHAGSNGYENLALGAQVTEPGAGVDGNWDPSKLVDGILISKTGSYGYTNQGLDSFTPSSQPTIQFDLGKKTRFNRFHLYPRTNLFAVDGTTCAFPLWFELQISDDASAWTTVAEVKEESAPYKKPTVVQLDETVSARYVRLVVKQVSAAPGDNTTPYLQMAEFGVYNVPLDSDKEALQSLVDKANALNREDYSADTWEAVMTARDQAVDVLNNGMATQEDINTAYEGLAAAIDALQPAVEPVVYKVGDYFRAVAQDNAPPAVSAEQPWAAQLYTADGWANVDTFEKDAFGNNLLFIAPKQSDGSETIGFNPSAPDAGFSLFPSAFSANETTLDGNAAMSFTAPADGRYNFSGSFRGTYTDGFNRVRVTVNGETVWSGDEASATLVGWQDVHYGDNISAAFTVGLKAGDVLRVESTRAEWGNTVTVTLQMTYTGPFSSNTALTSIDGITLNETFDPAVHQYTATVSNAVTAVDVTAVADSKRASVQVTGGDNLQVGENTVTITVTAEDGTTAVTTITVTREAYVPSSNADLASLALSAGSLTPQFDKDVLAYTATVDNDVESLRVTAVAADAERATVVVTGGDNLQVGENILTVKVTAEDGTEKTYTIRVTRLAATGTTGSSTTETTGSSTTETTETEGTSSTASTSSTETDETSRPSDTAPTTTATQPAEEQPSTPTGVAAPVAALLLAAGAGLGLLLTASRRRSKDAR